MNRAAQPLLSITSISAEMLDISGRFRGGLAGSAALLWATDWRRHSR